MFRTNRIARGLCAAGAMITLGVAYVGAFATTTEAATTTTTEYGATPEDPTTTTEAVTTTTTEDPTTTAAVLSEVPLRPTIAPLVPVQVASQAVSPGALPATGRGAETISILGLFVLGSGLTLWGLSRRPRSLES